MSKEQETTEEMVLLDKEYEEWLSMKDELSPHSVLECEEDLPSKPS